MNEFAASSMFFGLFITLGAFLLAVKIRKKTGKALFNPLLISIILVMFVLPQILLIGSEIVDKSSFSMPKASLPKVSGSGHVRVDGMVRGEIHGYVSGIIRADINGDVDLNLISGKSSEEGETHDET